MANGFENQSELSRISPSPEKVIYAELSNEIGSQDAGSVFGLQIPARGLAGSRAP